MELDRVIKNNLKEQRLNEYKQKIFMLQMDLVALKTVNDTEAIKLITDRIEALVKAHKAVKEM